MHVVKYNLHTSRRYLECHLHLKLCEKAIVYKYIIACGRDSLPPELILILKFEKKEIYIQNIRSKIYDFYSFNVSFICTYNPFD